MLSPALNMIYRLLNTKVPVQIVVVLCNCGPDDVNHPNGARTLDPGSQNFNWGVPLVSLPGRYGLDLAPQLTYNSLVWTKDGRIMRFNADHGYPAPGSHLGLPTLQLSFTTGGGHVVRTSDGTQYVFSPSVEGEWRCTTIKDRNSNFISASYDANGHLLSITDTLGCVLNFNYDPVNPMLLSSIHAGRHRAGAAVGALRLRRVGRVCKLPRRARAAPRKWAEAQPLL